VVIKLGVVQLKHVYGELDNMKVSGLVRAEYGLGRFVLRPARYYEAGTCLAWVGTYEESKTIKKEGKWLNSLSSFNQKNIYLFFSYEKD